MRLHREALESDHVSAHLHEWIDLVFGYAQRGPDAARRLNLFNPLCSENGVLDALGAAEDAEARAHATERVAAAGQLPGRVFVAAHPPRQPRPAGYAYPDKDVALAAAALDPPAAPAPGAAAASPPLTPQLSLSAELVSAAFTDSFGADCDMEPGIVAEDGDEEEEEEEEAPAPDPEDARAPEEAPAPAPAPETPHPPPDWPLEWHDATKFAHATAAPAPAGGPAAPAGLGRVHRMAIAGGRCLAAAPYCAFLGLQPRHYLRVCPFRGRGYVHALADHAVAAELPLPVPDPLAVTSLALAPTGSLVALGTADGAVHALRLIWEDAAPEAPGAGRRPPREPHFQVLGRIVGHQSPVRELLLRPEHSLLVSVTDAPADPPSLWHCGLSGVAHVRRLAGLGAAVACATVSPGTGDVLLAAAGGRLCVWNANGHRLSAGGLLDAAEDGDLTALAVLQAQGFTSTTAIGAAAAERGAVLVFQYDTAGGLRAGARRARDAAPPRVLRRLPPCAVPGAGPITAIASEICAVSYPPAAAAAAPSPAPEPAAPTYNIHHLFCGTREGHVVRCNLPSAVINALRGLGPAEEAGPREPDAAPENNGVCH